MYWDSQDNPWDDYDPVRPECVDEDYDENEDYLIEW